MGEADLGAVDGTVARRLDEGEEVMVSGIDDDLLEDGLRDKVSIAFNRVRVCRVGSLIDSVGGEGEQFVVP